MIPVSSEPWLRSSITKTTSGLCFRVKVCRREK